MDNIYIKNAKLKGYKSIKEVDIDLENGLNIIIGKNGSGKTNFLSFLNMSLTEKFENVSPDFYSEILFENKEMEFSRHIFYEKKKTKDFFLKKENVITEFKPLEKNEILKVYFKIVKHITPFIQHGLPSNYLFLFEKPFSLKVANKVSEEINEINNLKTPNFIKLIFNIFNFLFIDENKLIINEENICNFFNENVRKNLQEKLKKFSPIEDIRLNENFNLSFIEDGFNVSNLFFEYKVNGTWLPFSYLSDGTKRCFLIIAEVAFNKIDSSEESIENTNKVYKSIPIFIEEPELGLHPHQLYNLMLFLEEEAENKQIIISTHSPEILDHISHNELNRIILSKYEKEKGTTLRHLTEIEKEKINEYLKELELSDYWKHSDLEK